MGGRGVYVGKWQIFCLCSKHSEDLLQVRLGLNEPDARAISVCVIHMERCVVCDFGDVENMCGKVVVVVLCFRYM